MSRKLVRRTDEILGLGAGPEVSAAELLRGARADHLRVAEVPIDWVHTNPDQPRRHFDDAALAALAESIDKRGLLQPVVLRPDGARSYLLMAGERRLRAFRLLGRTTIPALIRDLRGEPDVSAEELALIENVQRVDLNAVELAGALGRLGERHAYSQRDLAGIVGRDVAWVNRLLGVRGLPGAIVEAYLADPGAVSMSALIEVAAADGDQQAALWEQARGGATVRDLKTARKEGSAGTAPAAPRTPDAVVARSILGLRRTVRTLHEHRGALDDHREELLALRAEIDELLR